MRPNPKAAPLDQYEEKRLREMSLSGYEPGAAQWIEGLLATLDKERAEAATPQPAPVCDACEDGEHDECGGCSCRWPHPTPEGRMTR